MKQRWTRDEIDLWHRNLPWLVGCNFIPSTAINQIEMWSKETFDEQTIDRELGWASDLGFNVVRVYLHDIPWKEDAEGFKSRLDRFLSLAAKHDIRVFPVIFDDCWFEPVAGEQPVPRPGIHNSGWVRSPGRAAVTNESCWVELELYVKDIAARFGNDPRIIAWDVYNEVANFFLPVAALPEAERTIAYHKVLEDRPAQAAQALKLLEHCFQWLREVGVAQPLTAPVYFDEPEVNEQLASFSDFISFHCYEPPAALRTMINRLRQHDRPMWCTEYLSRVENSLFETHLPIFKEHKIAAINWGLVDGKTQTKFAWSDQGGDNEPEKWFHDVLRKDGTPYSSEEVSFVRRFIGETPADT